jgi:penicillin-insensitive murein DD-endopeptidase
MRYRYRLRSLVLVGCALLATLVVSDRQLVLAEPLSFGGGNCGKLEGGTALPCSGPNFDALAGVDCTLGRNYVHPLVAQTVVDAYGLMRAKLPQRIWQYGETGKKNGGSLWPHKSHQNGLAVDFFMPVVDAAGKPEQLTGSVLNKLGYALEFDQRGHLDGLDIDWSAVGQHLLALEAAGRAHDVRIERIIVTPAYHERLFVQTPELRRLEPLFMKKEAWVRHDEHYHVDFAIPDRQRRPLRCK